MKPQTIKKMIRESIENACKTAFDDLNNSLNFEECRENFLRNCKKKFNLILEEETEDKNLFLINDILIQTNKFLIIFFENSLLVHFYEFLNNIEKMCLCMSTDFSDSKNFFSTIWVMKTYYPDSKFKIPTALNVEIREKVEHLYSYIKMIKWIKAIKTPEEDVKERLIDLNIFIPFII